MISQTGTPFISKDRNKPRGFNMNHNQRAHFVIHSLSCCHNHQPGVHAANLITRAVNFYEAWKYSSDVISSYCTLIGSEVDN